jgi:Kef-type K+ transport system membrane component KefB
MWRKADALRTPNGELLTDVAEMDDISAVALMALLFAMVPVLRAGAGGEDAIGPELGQAAAVFMLKLIGFAALCVLLARFLERRLTRGFARIGSPAELMVLVAGLGIVIAGLAGSLGFSAAIGALFAGIAFSRDPQAVDIDANFRGIYDLLTPFFFVGIGLSITPGGLVSAFSAGIVLFVIAAFSKLAGHGLCALVTTGSAGAVAIGVSMIPRAEITMVVMEQGQSLGSWAVPDELFAAFVLTSALTCLMAPVALQIIFRRWPDAIGRKTKAKTSD